MKRLSCVVGITLALGAAGTLVAEDLPSHIDVVIVSESIAQCIAWPGTTAGTPAERKAYG